MVDSPNPPQWSKLTLTATSFTFLQATALAVVNGSEIDFFNSRNCEVADAVGRYRWTLSGGMLHFDALNDDPCERRDLFTNVTYTLVSHLP